MKIHDILFIGAGASALMAASHLQGHDVALVDTNPKIGAKLLISGGGKCNLTNRFATADNYLGDQAFIAPILSSFDASSTLSFVKQHHLSIEERDHGQIFCANSAKELVSLFGRLTSYCTFYLSTKVLHVTKNDHFVVQSDKGEIHAKKVVVASGGLSYASIGASDIGYKIAASFGHTIVTPSPALVGLTLQKEQFWMKELSGIALPVVLHVEGKRFSENLLFAHKGISGPVVLSGSLYWKKGNITIDFLPHIQRMEALLKAQSKKQIITALGLPRRLIKAFLDAMGMEDKVLSKLTVHERTLLCSLKSYTFAPAGNFGYTKAEVTKGGVSTSEIDQASFESLKCKDLYFIGEVLDVTGELGGFNFQWAFASASLFVKAII
ncbi:aminoacetone oxidase family FAD-binding enzyme [Sulfurospirillum diekertiae]|uniref:Aminoacetone oxidase family FAD-binding enzyme n=1 Tax=Sulfurospirillum diekertiae TaxID=1854492 RepID=A0A6G9VW87_9BACT|nr:aminoacetone oxidase family FAD-binding enzyme [Sulfurospirillum diekertiae]QIR79883.1 aminoacetone oxidase family FAD-binding enzyme [Sulfurospirillum diekertiae]